MIQPGIPLLVLSCSKTKRPAGQFDWVPFADLYDGPMWHHVRASAYPRSNVAAISALYGFLEPGREIHTYDHVMDEDASRRICTLSNDVWRLGNAIAAAGSAFIVGGELYKAVGRTAIRRRSDIEAVTTFAQGSFLAQRKQLRLFLEAHEAAPPAVAEPAGRTTDEREGDHQ